MDSVDELFIALLQQSVCLVQHKEPTLLQTELTCLDEVLQSARGGHHYVHSVVEG